MTCTTVYTSVLLFMLIAVVGGTVMAGEAMRAVDRGVGRYQRDGGRSRGVEQSGGGGRVENEDVQRCFNSSSLCNNVRTPTVWHGCTTVVSRNLGCSCSSFPAVTLSRI